MIAAISNLATRWQNFTSCTFFLYVLLFLQGFFLVFFLHGQINLFPSTIIRLLQCVAAKQLSKRRASRRTQFAAVITCVNIASLLRSGSVLHRRDARPSEHPSENVSPPRHPHFGLIQGGFVKCVCVFVEGHLILDAFLSNRPHFKAIQLIH